MTVQYLQELSVELRSRGVRGARRRRILAETEDHLLSDPGAAARFGDPAEIAQAFADDLGTRGALRAPLWAFAGLAVAGLFYAAMFLAWSGLEASQPRRLALIASGAVQSLGGGHPSWLGLLAAALLLVAPQVAFAAGVLALARALRLRGRARIPAAEVRALRRRTTIAVAFGLASLGGVALFAQQFATQLPGWSGGALGGGVVGAVVSAAVVVACAGAGLVGVRARVAVAGPAGDVFDDLGPVVPARLRGRPWTFAAAVAAGVGLLVWLAGVAASDPYDGALRGLTEAGACLLGFALLGRYLSLRS